MTSHVTMSPRGFRRARCATHMKATASRPRGWDVVSREAGVVAGALQWAERLADYSEELHRELDEARAGNDSPEWRIQRLEGDRESVERLGAFIAGLAEALMPPAESTWSADASWAQRLVDRYLGGEGQRSDWPEPELEAARRVSAALAGLGHSTRSPPRASTSRGFGVRSAASSTLHSGAVRAFRHRRLRGATTPRVRDPLPDGVRARHGGEHVPAAGPRGPTAPRR